ncbi:DUF3970 family protein [Bacillus sp. FJAT-45037]|uniref:DUF3970 family protein n=1 Tax=Bacillus sp. FJAT-45037 TaxID=2011007 RepID=UPI000C24877E|nr:DUF3970 family protein [Bacillus sp. FJAT-45037]
MRVRISGRDQQELDAFVKSLETLADYQVTYTSDVRDSKRTNNPKYRTSKELIQYLDVQKKV